MLRAAEIYEGALRDLQNGALQVGDFERYVIGRCNMALEAGQEAIRTAADALPKFTWLLEKVKLNPNAETLYYKRYNRPINGGRDDLHTVNPDPELAKRFETKELAENYAKHHDLSDVLIAVEHMFNCGTMPDRVEDLDIPAMMRKSSNLADALPQESVVVPIPHGVFPVAKDSVQLVYLSDISRDEVIATIRAAQEVK